MAVDLAAKWGEPIFTANALGCPARGAGHRAAAETVVVAWMLLSLAGVAYVVLMVGLGRALRASGVVIFWAC